MLSVRKYEIEYLYVTRRRFSASLEEKFGTDKRYLQKISIIFTHLKTGWDMALILRKHKTSRDAVVLTACGFNKERPSPFRLVNNKRTTVRRMDGKLFYCFFAIVFFSKEVDLTYYPTVFWTPTNCR